MGPDRGSSLGHMNNNHYSHSDWAGQGSPPGLAKVCPVAIFSNFRITAIEGFVAFAEEVSPMLTLEITGSTSSY